MEKMLFQILAEKKVNDDRPHKRQQNNTLHTAAFTKGSFSDGLSELKRRGFNKSKSWKQRGR